MPRLFIILSMFAITSTCCHADAQDKLFALNLFFEVKDVERTSPPSQETDKRNHDIALSLKATPHVLQQPDMMQYLTERQGKIPVYSGLDGKVQLEVGLAGYLGLKCRF